MPADAYYGVHTLRAVSNFPVTGISIGRWEDLVHALMCVKEAACKANWDRELIAPAQAEATIAACQDIRGGGFADH